MWSKAIAKANSITLHHQIKRQMICWQTEKDETNPALCSNLIQNRKCTTLCVHWTVCAIHIQCCTAADVRCTARWRRRCWRSWVAGVIIIFFLFSWWAVYLHGCTTLPQLNCASLYSPRKKLSSSQEKVSAVRWPWCCCRQCKAPLSAALSVDSVYWCFFSSIVLVLLHCYYLSSFFIFLRGTLAQ